MLGMIFMIGQGAMAQCPLVLDQSVTNADNTWNTGGYYVAQTFTAAISGNLMQISLNFQFAGSGSIVIFNGPDVTGTVLFSSGETFNTGWNNYTISSMPLLTSGNMYTIEVNSNLGTVLHLTDILPDPTGRLYWGGIGNYTTSLSLDFEEYISVLPTVSFTGNTSVCQGNPTTLSGTGAVSYSWTGGITNGVAFTPGSSSSYTVTGTGSNGCTNTATANVTVNSNPTPSISGGTSFCGNGTLDAGSYSSYIWDDASTNETRTVSSSGTYSVTVTNGSGCTGTASTTVTVNTPPSPTISGGVSFCSSEVLDAGSFSSYVWDDSSTGETRTVTATGTYSVTVTDRNGCTGTASITVTDNDPLPVITPNGSTTFCNGVGSVTLDAGSFSSYLWSTGPASETL